MKKKTSNKKGGRAHRSAPVYQAREGAHLSKECVRDVGQVIDRLIREKRCTRENLVEAARDPKSPAHTHFDWNDRRAAKAHRVEQARHYLKGIEIIVEELDDAPIRAFHPVFVDGEKKYERVGTIMNDVNLAEQLLVRAYNDLAAFKQRFAMLRKYAELTGVFAEIDAVLKKLGKKKAA